MSEEQSFPWPLQDRLHPAWDDYVDFITPFRPQLHQYCRRLTGNVWDGEDLVQEAIVRVFAVLGKRHALLPDARGYLVRTATNLWIDQVRRANREAAVHAQVARESPSMVESDDETADVRAAARTLLQQLAPQERAAVLMKDVFDLSLEETAVILHTTVGAVKAALHRGRERLRERDPRPAARPAPPREVVDRLVTAFSARDIAAVHAVISEDVSVELVGGAVAEGREESGMFFWFSMNSHGGTGGEADEPSFEVFEYEGEPLILGFRPQEGVKGLNEIHRLEVVDGEVTGIRCYCFCPDTLAFFGELLGRPVNRRPYRSPSLG